MEKILNGYFLIDKQNDNAVAVLQDKEPNGYLGIGFQNGYIHYPYTEKFDANENYCVEFANPLKYINGVNDLVLMLSCYINNLFSNKYPDDVKELAEQYVSLIVNNFTCQSEDDLKFDTSDVLYDKSEDKFYLLVSPNYIRYTIGYEILSDKSVNCKPTLLDTSDPNCVVDFVNIGELVSNENIKKSYCEGLSERASYLDDTVDRLADKEYEHGEGDKVHKIFNDISETMNPRDFVFLKDRKEPIYSEYEYYYKRQQLQMSICDSLVPPEPPMKPMFNFSNFKSN